jgi:hypothetical protein
MIKRAKRQAAYGESLRILPLSKATASVFQALSTLVHAYMSIKNISQPKHYVLDRSGKKDELFVPANVLSKGGTLAAYPA